MGNQIKRDGLDFSGHGMLIKTLGSLGCLGFMLIFILLFAYARFVL